MQAEKLRVQGSNVESVVSRIKQEYGEYDYKLNENIWICYSEDYSMRNNSNLVNSLIINQIDENSLEVDIISGGGASGVFQFTWGLETSRIKELVTEIKDICSEYKMQVEIVKLS